MQTREITSMIMEINPRLVVLLCHNNADPDTALAAYAFSLFLKHLNSSIEIEIGAAKGISLLTRSLLNIFPIEFIETPNIEEADLIVILDISNLDQLNDLGAKAKLSSCPIIVIDHHTKHSQTEEISAQSYIDENASSTCEIIYRFFTESNIMPNRVEAEALFLGIAFDTRHFHLANSQTFKMLADLTNSDIDTKELLSHLSLPMTHSERIARIKACQRLEMRKIGAWIIAVSKINSYQASAARALIKLGVHIAIIAGKKKKKMSISMRSCSEFYKKTKIHLGRDIAKPVGERLNGVGGGHSISAGLNAESSLKKGLNLILKILMNKIDS